MLPADLVMLARDFVELGVDIVVGRNAETGFLELSVPYRAKHNKRIYAYQITKQGTDISVRPLGFDSSECELSPDQRNELINLCATVERRLMEASHRHGAERAAIHT